MICIEVYGEGWYGQHICTTYNIRALKKHGEPHFAGDAYRLSPKESLYDVFSRWLDTNAGDFQRIEYWHAWEEHTIHRDLAYCGLFPDWVEEEDEA